jgi:hypothetical protein|tara:strand:+ start:189 stop:764 length:576 start_codon:yes stop_codon:yes gene_type:complete
MPELEPTVGSWLEEINDEAIRQEPRISEYQFQREVLTLLENPFDANHIDRYSRYVGELTKPLNVMSNDNQGVILFTVPPLVFPPRPTIAATGGVTAENLFYHLERSKEIGARDINDRVTEFMLSITGFGNLVNDVIMPIREILAKYGRKMVSIPGIDTPLPNGEQVSPTVSGSTETPVANNQSSFTDDYDD